MEEQVEGDYQQWKELSADFQQLTQVKTIWKLAPSLFYSQKSAPWPKYNALLLIFW